MVAMTGRHEVKIDITQSDKNHIDNLVRLLAKSEASLKGVEIIVAADAMRFLSSLQAKLNNKFNEPFPTVEATSTQTTAEIPVKKVSKGVKNEPKN